MGARHATLGSGGGKFNGVAGVIVDYEFTTTHPFAKPGGRRNSEFNPLFGVLRAQMDGSQPPDTDVMLVGSADDFEVSDEGKTITPLDGRPVWDKSQWGRFIKSLEDLKVATENDEYAEGVYNYNPIIGRRVRFAQEQQFDQNGKLKQREGKGRDGKKRLFDDTTTVVTADYGSVAASKTTQTKTATVSPATRPAAGKPNGRVQAAEADLTDTLDEALVGLLDKFGGSCSKAKLASAPAQLYLKKTFPENSDDVRRGVYDDEYILGAVERGIIASYEQSGKSQLITATT